MSIGKKIKGGLKKLFGWAVAGVKFVFAHTEIDEFAKREFLGFVDKAKALALDPLLSNSERGAALRAFILQRAKVSKLTIAGHLVNLFAELAYAKVRGSIAEQPQP
jgi:hypothetical protein